MPWKIDDGDILITCPAPKYAHFHCAMQGLTVVFDLDGTLVDTAPDLVAATNHALSELGLAPVQPRVLINWVSFGARRMIVEGLRHTQTELSDPEVDRLLARFLDYYEGNIANLSRPFDGAVAALGHLKSSGARLAICTNKRESLSRLLLNALDLAGYFEAVSGRDTFPVCKPHPDHLTGAITAAGGDPRHAIMVGDTNVDIETARAAFVPVIAVTFGYSDVPPNRLGAEMTIDHFDQLPSAIAALRPRRISDAGY